MVPHRPAVAQRASIHCANFPEFATCSGAVADYVGRALGKAKVCDMPEPQISAMRHALQVALPVVAQSAKEQAEALMLAAAAERAAVKRARFRLDRIGCAEAQATFEKLLDELGVRVQPM